MIIKRRTRNRIVDILHKGVVLACVGTTLYGCVLLGLRLHKYFTVIKPQQKLKEIEDNKHLLREGTESSDSALQDSAPELKL
jgi:hypothetical protein